MKIKNRFKLGIVLMLTSIISIFGIGFSSWIHINESNPIENEIDVSNGITEIDINGIEVICKTSFKIGKYFYYVDNASSSTINLIYTLQVTPSLLDSDYKIDNGDGYSFNLKGELSLSNLNVFNNNSNLESASFNEMEMDLIFNNSLVEFSIPVSTSSKDNNVEEFNLSFTFNNNLILNYRESLLNSHFTLKLYGTNV